MIGRRLGPYDITGRLGEGGMGEVYRAHDARLGRDIALKVLRPEVARDAVRLERFTREGRAVAALNHPHIVTIYSTEEADGVRFLTMELVEGQALDALIPHDGLPVARFLQLALPLADALTAAHQKQITHRDLKPGNVMVAADGRLKVLDFGLARFEPGAAEPAIAATRSVLTSEGTLVGTMPYMSPEQIEGRALDARSDLFSLGVMFYEMLSGARPFAGPSSAALMSAILRDTPAPLSERRADVPEALARLVARCLEKRPEDRVQTARDVFNELRHLQKQLDSGPTRASDGGAVATGVEATLWIAVLPFSPRSADPEIASLAAGLTEDITSGLSRFPALSVIAPQSARALADSTLDVRQVAERLGARYVIGGTVRRSAAGVRIAAHLIDARSGSHLWSDTFDQPLDGTDLFAVQDDVTDRIVATIADKAGVLARSMVQAVRELPLEQLSARELIFRCWMFQWSPTPAGHATTRAALERHLDRHADNPHLWAELAHLYICEHSLFFNPQPDALDRALRTARRSVELDPGNQEGWKMIALASFYQRDEALMGEAGDRAVRLNPRNSNALAWMGSIRTHAGDYDRGCELTGRAMTLNPAHPGWYHLASFTRDFARGEFAAALAAARRANMPEFMWMHFAVAAAAGQLGLTADARAAADAMLRLSPAFADAANLREFVTRWYWPPELIESLLDGVARAQGSPGVATRPPSSHPARPADRPPSASSDLRIAVLPFTHRGGELADGLADGLTDGIATGLSRFPHLRVVPASSAAILTPENAMRAGVRYLLEGRVQGSGHAVRVTIRLVDADTGSNLWSQTFDRAITTTAFEVQDDVTSYVVATVGDTSGVLARSMAASLLQRPVEELSVRQLVLRFHAYVEHFQADEHARLRGGLERALEREPLVAEGWACLADLYEHEHSQRLNPLPDSLGRQRRAAQRAVEIDPHNQRGWTAMAAVHTFEHDRAALRVAAERAIALNPLDADTLGLCALFLSCAGDDDRAMELFERAARLKPQHPGWYHFTPFTTFYKRREYAAALAEAKRVALPQLPTTHISAAAAAARAGSAPEAQAAVDALRRLDVGFLEPEVARQAVALWIWDEEHVRNLVDGLQAAIAMAGTPPAEARPSSGPAVAAGLISIAAPSFAARGGDTATELADGLTEDITTGLARFSSLRVVEGAGAQFRVEGSVRVSGASLRIAARLVDASSGAHLWADQFDRETASGTLPIQDEIAARIVTALADENGGVLIRTAAASLKPRAVDDLTAGELILRFHAYAEQFLADEHAELRRGFEQAVAREPRHAAAWACLSILYAHEAVLGLNPRPDIAGRQRAAADRALALDSQDQTVWSALAMSAAFTRDLTGLRAACERIVSLNPLSAHGVATAAIFLVFAGDVDRAAALVRQVSAHTPHHQGWYNFVPFLEAYLAGEYARALEHAKRIRMPVFSWCQLSAAAAAGQVGKSAEAGAALESLRASHPHLLDPDAARQEWTAWFWQEAPVERLVEGLEKALDLVSSGDRASRKTSDDGMRIAVLAFTARGGEDATALADGLTGDVTTALARFPYLRVVAPGAVRAMGEARDFQEASARLGARFLLEGAVRGAPGQVRVSVHLADAESGAHLWAEAFDRSLAPGLFAVQDDIVGCANRGWDLVVAGDVCYERPMAERVFTWFRRLAADGVQVLMADPGRSYLPKTGLLRLASYAVPCSRDLEDRDMREAAVYRIVG